MKKFILFFICIFYFGFVAYNKVYAAQNLSLETLTDCIGKANCIVGPGDGSIDTHTFTIGDYVDDLNNSKGYSSLVNFNLPGDQSVN